MEPLDHSSQMLQPEPASQWPIALRWGLIGGLAGIALQLIWQIAGLVSYTEPFSTGNLLLSPLSWGISLAAIALGIRQYRDEQLQGIIPFGKAFVLGFRISLVMALLSAIFTVTYLSDITKEAMNEVMQAQMESQGLDDSDMENAMKLSGFFTSPLFMGLSTFLGGAIWGALLALVGAAVMRKEPPQV
jgi:hypothetical protein